jgi:hypothetical protein
MRRHRSSPSYRTINTFQGDRSAILPVKAPYMPFPWVCFPSLTTEAILSQNLRD